MPKKPGVGVKGDAVRLDNFSDVTTNATMELLVLALSRRVDIARKKALAALCVTFCCRELCKDMIMSA